MTESVIVALGGGVGFPRSGPGAGRDEPTWPPRSLLGQIGLDARAALLRLGVPRRYRPSQVLMREGEATTGVALLRSGHVKVTGAVGGDRDLLLAVRQYGDVVGELATMSNIPRTATVTAATALTANRIDRSDFLAYLRAHPAAEAAIIGAIGEQLNAANRQRLAAATTPLLVRVARLLGDLDDRFGRPAASGRLIAAGLNHRELAELVGASEVGVQKALRQLRARGAIAVRHRQQVVLRRDLLDEVAAQP